MWFWLHSPLMTIADAPPPPLQMLASPSLPSERLCVKWAISRAPDILHTKASRVWLACWIVASTPATGHNWLTIICVIVFFEVFSWFLFRFVRPLFCICYTFCTRKGNRVCRIHLSTWKTLCYVLIKNKCSLRVFDFQYLFRKQHFLFHLITVCNL